MTIEVSKKPTKSNLNEIRNWLIDEEKETGNGFYCHWHIIEQCFKDNRMFCALDRGKAVGFLVYVKHDFWAQIEIVEIRPNLRRRDIGKKLVGTLFDDLKKSGVLVVKCEAPTNSSVDFCASMGFLKMADAVNKSSFSRSKLYLPLVDIAQDEVCEIWFMDWFKKKDSLPSKILQIKRDQSGRMLTPVITSYSQNWRLRWRRGDEILYDGRMKSFPYRKRGHNLLVVTECNWQENSKYHSLVSTMGTKPVVLRIV